MLEVTSTKRRGSGMITRIRRVYEALHPDIQSFLVFVLWNVLFVLGLLALENRHYTIVRIYICAGAIGFMFIGKWLMDAVRTRD
jgi:hypothetical protein